MNLKDLIRQKSDEAIVFLLRRHPITLFGNVLMLLMLLAAPFAAAYAISLYAPGLLDSETMRVGLILGASGFLLLVLLSFMTQFIDYYLDTWIITNDRILNVEQKGLFSRIVSELDLSKIQDVTSEVHGVVESVFDYGNVHIQTAGETERFIFREVPQPDEIRKRILELVEADRRKQGETR